MYADRFLTCWAAVLHLAYIAQSYYLRNGSGAMRMPSTYVLAIVVFLGYGVVRTRVERIETKTPSYYVADLLGHVLPLVLIKPELSYESALFAAVVVWLYLEYHRYDFCQLKVWYRNYMHYAFHE